MLCDVVPMESCHVLLGRLWQFDKKTMHNGLTNEIIFTHKEIKFVLHSLSPSQVVEDQMQVKKKINKEKESSTYNHISETTCSNCLGRKHKTSECPNKRVIILRGKDLSKENVSLTSSS